MLNATTSLFDSGTAVFERLAEALRLGAEPGALFRTLIAPLTDDAAAMTPAWPSEISDDHTPYEFSVAFNQHDAELRCLWEARDVRADLASQALAARALNGRLARHFPIDLARLGAVEDLFLPVHPRGLFAMWHAAAFRARTEPEFRVYLNPHAQGPSRAPAIVEEALQRLGFARAYRTLLTHAMRRGPELDDLRYFSLDLAPSAAARVKVYVFHAEATLETLEEASRPARSYVPGEVGDFVRAIAGPGPYCARPVATCYAFTSDDDAQPLTSTIHVPIRAYQPNDEIAYERLRVYCQRRGLPLEPLAEALNAVRRRPLAGGSGLITYASLRPVAAQPRLTVYLAAEAYRTDPPRAEAVAVRAPRPLPTPDEIVHRHEREPLTDHPYFQRMRKEPVDLGHMWRLFTNIRSGLSLHFPRRLAAVVARVTDERIRSLLAKQLDEELGEGDYSRAHIVLFEQLLAGLAAYRPATVDDLDLEPGRVLEERLELPYADPDGHVGVGAAMVIEIFGKQVDRFVAEQFRRQREVAPETLTWLNLHESLELEHAEESLVLGRLVPATDEARAAVHRGARAVAEAGWGFFDGMYRACYR